MPVVPVASSVGASTRFRAQRERDTQPELRVRRLLHRRGYRYRLHQRLIPGLRRTVDIVFPRERVAVDVRGCFWHSCPQHGSSPQANGQWWAEKLARNVARDIETETVLREQGWNVVIVWEHETADEAVSRVVDVLRTRRELASTRQ